MRKVIVILMALVLIAPAAVLAGRPHQGRDLCGPGRAGFGGPGGKGIGPGHHLGIELILRHADEINLTDEQETELEKLQFDFQMQRIDQKAQIEKAEIQLRRLVHDEEAAEREVMKQIDEVAGLRAGMHKMRYSHRRQFRTVLEEEQLDKLKEMRKQRLGQRHIEFEEEREIEREIFHKRRHRQDP